MDEVQNQEEEGEVHGGKWPTVDPPFPDFVLQVDHNDAS